MSADRARLTHYPPRKYREVVSQQGRVLLEAETNEGQRIFTEETRHGALDFVGPCGTPDDGYKVVAAGADFTVGPGTMYVGGVRVTLEKLEHYSAQPDWLDKLEVAPWAEGLWQSPAALSGKNFEATLVLREQEITAVEDPALREVALGGPDGGARTRFLQRVVAAATTASTCAAAAADAVGFWSAHGLVYDANTASLKSRAQLQVTPVVNAPPASKCDPPSASGYLGADNQMLRVQVTAYDPVKNAGTLLWGYYNASTLYRSTVQTSSTLKLGSRPVSAEYQPRSGQVVQVLQRAADLGEGAFAAALTGHFARLTAPYAPDTQIVTLPTAMPQPPYANGANVYLRLWEDQVDFTLGTPAILPGTGLQVTLTASTAGPLHIGDYWCVAARPTTPNTVYPERLITSPQPPDGPRMWACPLAVMQGGKAFKVLEDCRPVFVNLVKLTARQGGGCCCVKVTSAQGGSLQEIIDQAAAGFGAKTTIEFEAGAYHLKQPLIITSRHKGLTLEACTGGKVTLSAASNDSSFFFGLIFAIEGADLTLRGLELQTPIVPAAEFLAQGGKSSSKRWTPKVLSFGIRAVYCDSLRLEDCTFQLPEADLVFGAAVFVQGDTGLVEASRCGFFGPPSAADSLCAGVLATPLIPSAKDNVVRPTTINICRIERSLFAFTTYCLWLGGGMRYVWVSGNTSRGTTGGVILTSLSFDTNQAPKFAALSTQLQKSSGKVAQLRAASNTANIDLMYEVALTIGLASRASEIKSAPGEKPVTLGDRGAVAKLPPVDLPGVDGPPQLCLTLEANQLDCRPLVGATESTCAICIRNISDARTYVNITGNTAWNRSSLFPTLVVETPTATNITGNLLVNDVPSQTFTNGIGGGSSRPALWVIPGPSVPNSRQIPILMMTVTGNTAFGSSNLDSFAREEYKDTPSGLNTWAFFNTITG